MRDRREFLKAGLGAAGAVLAGGMVARGDDPADETDFGPLFAKMGEMMKSIPFKVTDLGGGLELIEGPGGNIAVLDGPDGALMIDSGVPQRADDLLGVLGKRRGKPVKTLVNTHWHFDHAGGNEAIGKTGAAIWSTPATRARLASDQYTPMFKMNSPASPPVARPGLTFENASLDCGGARVEFHAVPPAHTDGDLFVHFTKADVIHTGDLFSNGFYPNIDGSSRGWIGGMVAAADVILKAAGPKTRIIPGHGPLAARDDLVAARTMLATVHDRLAKLADAGKTLDQAVAARPIADLDPTWAKGFFNGAMFTKIAYDGILKHRAESSR